MKEMYIRSACAISPQQTFDTHLFLQPARTISGGKLFVLEPDYRAFINPVAIRRMSRLLKMGIASGMCALQRADISSPDAIITGTGLGSMTDMEQFLKDMIHMKEEALNPTFFIQSTYNSVNGWLALQSKCKGYNQTYVHRGWSLELSLLDAQLYLSATDEPKVVLAGAFDELTDEYFIVKSKIGYWKEELPDNLSLLQCNDTPGTIAGEGAAFFTLSNRPNKAACALKGIKMIPDPAPETISDEIMQFLSSANVDISSIDFVITGMNGDVRFEPLYQSALSAFYGSTGIGVFKHLTGEFPTASAFALWLAVHLLTAGRIPEEIVYRKPASQEIRYLLIVNHYILNTASLILCERA